MNKNDLDMILELKNIIKVINNELSRNRQDKFYFSIEQILVHNSPSKLYEILLKYSPTYCVIYDNHEYDNIKFLLDEYIQKVYKYYDKMLFSEQNKFDQYVSYSKSDSVGDNSYTREDLEMDLHNISNTIGLMNEAIRLWYEIYQDKLLVAEFSDGEVREFKIKEGELAHLFGVIWSSLKNNEGLKKMGIIIPDKELTPEEKYEILLRITEMYNNGNILDYEEDRLRKMLNEKHVYNISKLDQKFDFYRQKDALLPYPKINVRSKAFIDYKPLDRLSLLIDFKRGEKIIKNDKDDVKNTILLSRNSYSDKFGWTGIVNTEDFLENRNYMRSLLLNTDDEHQKYLEKLDEPHMDGGFKAKESITTKIILESESSSGGVGSFCFSENFNGGSPSGGTGGNGSNSPGNSNNDSNGGGGNSFAEARIFSEEEQMTFISEIVNDFDKISFRNLIEYYEELIYRYRNPRRR